MLEGILDHHGTRRPHPPSSNATQVGKGEIRCTTRPVSSQSLGNDKGSYGLSTDADILLYSCCIGFFSTGEDMQCRFIAVKAGASAAHVIILVDPARAKYQSTDVALEVHGALCRRISHLRLYSQDPTRSA